MFAVHPQPEGENDRSVTSSASPGSAPSTYTGPHTGFTWPKSSRVISARLDAGVIWPPERIERMELDALARRDRAAGGKSRFQPRWLSRSCSV